MRDHLKALTEKIIIRGTVEALTALHIGWQRSYDPVESDGPVIKDLEGKPYIPGSSFKGVLRGFIEGLLAGADLPEHLRPCFPTDGGSCIKDKDIENVKMDVAEINKNERVVSLESKIAERIIEKACPVCRIFGSSYMGSKLKIKDMPLKSEWHESFLKIRDGIVIDRDSRTTRDGGKYDFEIVSPGMTFNMEIVGDNLAEDEKGLIFTAFELITQGFGALGGNVSRGTGRISIKITGIEELKTKDLFQQYKANDGIIKPKTFDKPDEIIAYEKKMKDAFFAKFNSQEGR